MNNMTRRTISAPAAFLLGGLMASASHEAIPQETPSSLQGETSNIEQVWRREDEYGRYSEAGNLHAYKSLFHDKFIGWSCSWEHPKRKVDVGEWVRQVREKRIKVTAELTREGAEDFGNVVIVHYRATEVDTYPDGHTEGKGEVYKLTHTWMRTGDTWLIIGGMCATLNVSPM